MGKKEVVLAVIARDINYIKETIDKVQTHIDGSLVSKDEFEGRLRPLEKVVYGIVALVLTTVGVALISLVVIKQ